MDVNRLKCAHLVAGFSITMLISPDFSSLMRDSALDATDCAQSDFLVDSQNRW